MTVIINQSVNISSLFWSMGKCLLAKVSAKWWKLCWHAILTNIVSDNLVVIYYSWKGVCHEMFDPFFSWFEPIWAPDKQPKVYFRIRFRFRRDIRSQSDLCGVQHIAEMYSAVWIPPRTQNQILDLSVVDFKETIRRNPFRGEHICHERKDLKYKILIY